MPLSTNVFVGQSGHDDLHNEERAALNAATDRANHTGTQDILTVNGLETALDAKQAAVLGLRQTVLWDGAKYVLQDGTTAVTAGNRVSGTFRDFVGPSDPNAAGLMVDGDAWDSTA